MHEKLLEDWMDSATERQYQPIFCQALAAAGHTILHSTRHGPLELGKDVITRAPDKKIYAFQLKGNPSSRMTMSEWTKILTQINSLIHHPVDTPLVDIACYCVPVLVTNGDVDEEVQAAISIFNKPLGKKKTGPQKLRLISRGKLLDDYIKPAASSLLPKDFSFDEKMYRLLAETGVGMLPVKNFCEVMEKIFDWREATERRTIYKIHGCCLIGLLILGNWNKQKNHLAVIYGYAILAMHCLVKCLEAKISPKTSLQVTGYVREGIYSAGKDLLEELVKAQDSYYYERSPLFEFAYHTQRLGLIQAVLSSLYLGLETDEGIPKNISEGLESNKDFVAKFVTEIPISGLIVGEMQIPQFLVRYWFLSKCGGDLKPDIFLMALERALIASSLSKDETKNLPNPYYDAEETLEHYVKLQFGLPSDLLERESFGRQSWFAMPIFGLLVRRNWKQIAKSFFPDLSRIIHKNAVITNFQEFCKFRSDKVRDTTELLTFPGNWNTYIERSRSKKNKLLDYTHGNIVSLLVFLIICPFRMTESTVYWLDEKFLGNWHPKETK